MKLPLALCRRQERGQPTGGLDDGPDILGPLFCSCGQCF